ncbi:MAG: MBL fold metallo-hydrolase [Candidatus Thermoplasmatota archaeon]
MHLTFHGGTGSIGGNKLLLEAAGARLMLDFGRDFSAEKRFYDPPFLEPRNVEHHLGTGLLPPIPGIYKNDDREATLDAVYLSHPHTDHTDYIRYLKDEIPIYCGETAQTILTARDESGRPAADYRIASLGAKGKVVLKQFAPFRTGDTVHLDPLRLRPVHVDHSTLGSYGVIVESKDRCIAYTGDLRCHGHRGEMTSEFIAAAREYDLDALVIEGTNIDSAGVSSEDEVCKKVRETVSDATGLVMCGFPMLDFDRLRTFYEAARDCNRRMVLSAKQAYLLHALRDDEHLELFSLSDPNVAVYRREKSAVYAWEKVLEDALGGRTEDAASISKHQDEVLLFCTYFDMNELIAIEPRAGSLYILSSSEPFDEEGEIDRARLENWLAYFGIPLYQIHASGHAGALELKEMIETMKPKRVYPVHTERPEIFQRFMGDLGVEIIPPQRGVKYEV